MRTHSFFLTLVSTVAAVASAQIPTRTPAKPDAEWSEPFSSLAGVRELADGRVIISDTRDKLVQVIRFGGEAVKIEREGAGSGIHSTAVFW